MKKSKFYSCSKCNCSGCFKTRKRKFWIALLSFIVIFGILLFDLLINVVR